MNRYFKSILPTAAQWILFLIIPIVLTVYFVVSKYSDQFSSTQGVDYISVQNNILGQLYISGSLTSFFTKFMNFAFWGLMASVVVLMAWGTSVARTSLENHVIEEKFVNFRASKESWHGHFLIVALVKAILIFVMIYSLLSLLITAIPRLTTGVAKSVQILNVDSLYAVLYGVFLIILFQALFIVGLNIFKHTHAE